MTAFNYRARDKEGMSIAGVVEAETEIAVVENLRHLGYSVVSIHRQGITLEVIWQKIKSYQKVPKRDVIFFARQLSALLKSGLPIITAITSISQQVKNEKFKAALENVIEQIQGGATLSDALAQHSVIFNNLFVSMVQVGETGGVLDQVLDRLVYLMGQEMETASRVKSALIYPSILVLATIAIVAVFVVGIIPKFISVFETYDAELPVLTQMLLWISEALRQAWYLFIVALAGVLLWLRSYLKTERGLYKFNGFILKIPVVGEFYIKVIVARFARVLSVMVRSGVPILRALAVTEETVNNVVISRVIHNISDAVTEGQSLVEPFQASGIFPPMVIQMISAGEKSGRIDQMLDELANYYDQETEHTLRNLTTLLEPVLLLTMGGIVLVIALSVLLPIFNLIKVFRANF